MPTAPDRRRVRHPVAGAILLAVTAALVVSGCGLADPPMNPAATGAPAPSGSDAATPGPTASPGDSASPGTTPGGTASPGGTITPSGSAAPVSCTSVTPIRVERSAVEPRRATEIVTVLSDGRNLTPGTREQTEFKAPELTAPDSATTITEEATLTKIADLIESSSKHTVLLTRPDPPDTGVDTNKRPYDATGTYVVYNASGLLSADVVVNCARQEQRWRFTSEADNAVGTISCAVEPPKGNAVARQVYGGFC